MIGLAILFVAIVIIAFSSSSSEHEPGGQYLEEAESQGSEAPSAENVDPGFHARIMALEAEAEAAPSDTSILLELAHLRHDAHQLEEAVEAYLRVLEIAPRSKQVRLDLALSYAELGQWNEARSTTTDLLELYPNDPEGLYNLGAIHANMQEYDQARATWERVAFQTENIEMAERALSSLGQLDAISANPSPGPVDPSAPLPPDHPVIPERE